MKIKIAMAILALCFAAGCASAGKETAGKGTKPISLRVMTYNIHHAAGQDGKLDVARIAAVIQSQNPDLVALQEVDVNTTRSGGIDEASELARLSGMHVAFGKAIDFSGGDFGQAILSKFPILQSQVHPLPGDPKKEHRIALEAQIQLSTDARLQFVTTHLDHTGGTNDRQAQAGKLVELFGVNDANPTLLAGDFNATPDSPAMQLILQHFINTSDDLVPSFPSDAPTRKIDWILVRHGDQWRILKSWVVPEVMGSDHRPLMAEVQVTPLSPGK